MVFLTLPNGAQWFCANWVFRQLTEDVSSAYPEDTELREMMKRAQWYGGQYLEKVDKILCSRITKALQSVGEDALQGKMEGRREGDVKGHRQYLKTPSELLDLIKQQRGV